MKRAFTMTELLIVIAVIVIVLGLAVPAFNYLTASNSEAKTMNQIAGMIARTRTEAMAGTADYTGLLFYKDAANVTRAAIVVSIRETSLPTYPEIWLDLKTYNGSVADSLAVSGGIQVIDDAATAGTNRLDDAYVGFNSFNATPGAAPIKVKYGGLILFDKAGRLVRQNVGFAVRVTSDTDPTKLRYTALGAVFYDPAAALIDPSHPHRNVVPSLPATPEFRQYRSALGFVVYPEDQFKDYDDADPQATGTAYSTEAAEERWIDANAQLSLVNMKTGAIIKSD